MSSSEAKSRIKINKLLEESGWRLLDNKEVKASDGTYLELPDGSKAEGGLTPNFGIEVGFMF